MAINSISGTVIGNEVQYDYMGQGNAKGVGVIAYIDYTLDVTDNLTMKIKFKDETLDDYYYQIKYDDGIKFAEFPIVASGKYRVPIGVSYNEESFILEFTGLVGGTINIEFVIDSAYH